MSEREWLGNEAKLVERPHLSRGIYHRMGRSTSCKKERSEEKFVVCSSLIHVLTFAFFVCFLHQYNMRGIQQQIAEAKAVEEEGPNANRRTDQVTVNLSVDLERD